MSVPFLGTPISILFWSRFDLRGKASRADSTGCSLGGRLGGRQQEATLIFHSPSCVAGCVAPKTSLVPMRSLLLVWWQIDFCTGETRLTASTYALSCVLRLWVKTLRQVYKMDGLWWSFIKRSVSSMNSAFTWRTLTKQAHTLGQKAVSMLGFA